MKKFFLLISILNSIVWGKYFALLAETASGGSINSDKDVITMKKLLGDRYKFIILNEPKATSSNIRSILIKLSKELTSKDTFVFYYSGHGDRFYRGDSHESDRRDDFLLTSDAKCSGKAIVNVLIDDELNYLYSKIKARKIIIIDACHSADMQKAVIEDRIKKFKGCSKGVTTRGFNVDPKWRKAQNRNFLHFAAAKEEESALGSKDGGVFTLALKKVIDKKGNITFAQLEKELKKEIKQFTPVISRYSTIDKNSLYTKDIFAIPHSSSVVSHNKKTLREILESKNSSIEVVTQKQLLEYNVGRDITIKGYLKNPKNLYLIELKGDNSFKLIASKPKCAYVKDKRKYMCFFSNLKATKPTGRSDIYMISAENKLNFNNSKDSIITSDNFDSDVSLEEQLQNNSIKVGKITINTK